MDSAVRTAWGSHLQSSQLLGIPYEVMEFTTLNEKFNIQNGITFAPGIYPKVKYFCIGNGGHTSSVGADGIALTKAYQHAPTDAALFKHIPFVLRTLDNDLTALQRQNYALRKEVTYNSTQYIAYYLRRIDMTAVVAQLDYRSVTDGVVSSTPYTPTSAALTPVPTVLSNVGVNTILGDYIATTSVVNISFTAEDIAELINVANVIYSDDNYAIISEIGLCSGVDKVINVTPSVGGNFNFNEAISVQIISFMEAMHLAKQSTNGIDKFINMGCVEALYKLA